MLVLTRKTNQSIMIGDDIEVIVVDVKNNQVKLGIKAPRSITVHRAEVWEEIQAENVAALKSAKVNNSSLSALSSMIKGIKKGTEKKDKKK